MGHFFIHAGMMSDDKNRYGVLLNIPRDVEIIWRLIP